MTAEVGSVSRLPGPLAGRPLGHSSALEGVRGVAILLVMLVHLYAPVFPGGSSGVDLFFVLSGFLITKLALDEWQRRGSFSWSAFYRRRVFRILPALFVLLAVMLVCSVTLLADEGSSLRREVLLSGLSIGNLWPVFYGFRERGALGHTWSLGIEEQFYLVWPLLLLLVPMALRAPKRFAWRVGVVTAASLVVTRLLVIGVWNYPHWQSIPLCDFDGLALGCILALTLHSDDRGWSRRLATWPAVLAIGVVLFDLFAASAYLDHDHHGLRSPILRICFVYLVAYVVTRPLTTLSTTMAQPVLRWFGRYSYSLYLWHVPIFHLLSSERHPSVPRLVLVPTKLALSIAAAIVSHRFVEQPMIHYGRRIGLRRDGAAPTA